MEMNLRKTVLAPVLAPLHGNVGQLHPNNATDYTTHNERHNDDFD